MYEEAGSAAKLVMISVLEVLYDNKLCALVYMRDITTITRFMSEPVQRRETCTLGTTCEEIAAQLALEPNEILSHLGSKLMV